MFCVCVENYREKFSIHYFGEGGQLYSFNRFGKTSYSVTQNDFPPSKTTHISCFVKKKSQITIKDNMYRVTIYPIPPLPGSCMVDL